MRTAASRVDVRRAGPDDAAVVLAMLREFAVENGDPLTSDEAGWRRMLGRPEVVVLVADRDGEPVGYVSAVRRLHLWSATDILGLDDLFVRQGYRDAGVGRLLMLELARLAAPEGLLVRWEVAEDNLRAQQLYQRLGATLRSKVIASWPPESFPLTDGVRGT